MRKSKLFKGIAVLVACIMAATLLLSGCGKKDENVVTASSTSSAASSTAVQEQQKLDPVTLSWCIPNDEQASLDVVEAELNKTLKEKINAELQFQIFGWGEYDQKMQVKIAGGEDFDLCFTTLGWVNKYQQNVAKGAFAEMDGLLDKYAPTLKASIPEKYWGQTKVGGKIYCAPNYQIIAYSSQITVDKILAEKYNFDPTKITKFEDIEPFMDNILKNENGVTPFCIYKNGSLSFEAKWGDGYPLMDRVCNFVGVQEDSAGLKTVNWAASKEFMDFCKLMRKWQQKGYIRKDAASITDPKADIKAGKYAITAGGNYKPGGEIDYKNSFGKDVICIPFQTPRVTAGAAVAAATAISKTSKNPERAMMLMELAASDKAFFNTMIYGIENTNYKKVDADTIELIAKSGYQLAAWELGNQFNSYLFKGQQPNVWEETIKLNDEAELTPLAKINMLFDQEPVKSEAAQLQSIYDEFMIGLLTGSVDPDVIVPKMLEKIKGPYEKVEAEVINQIAQATKK